MSRKPGNGSGKVYSFRLPKNDASCLEAIKDNEHPNLDLAEFLRAAVLFYLEAAEEFDIDHVTYRPKVRFPARDGTVKGAAIKKRA